MTPKALEAFEYIKGKIEERGVSPTYQEVADALGIKSKSGVARLVDVLVEARKLERTPNRHGGLTLPPAENALSQFSTEALWAELERRGALED